MKISTLTSICIASILGYTPTALWAYSIQINNDRSSAEFWVKTGKAPQTKVPASGKSITLTRNSTLTIQACLPAANGTYLPQEIKCTYEDMQSLFINYTSGSLQIDTGFYTPIKTIGSFGQPFPHQLYSLGLNSNDTQYCKTTLKPGDYTHQTVEGQALGMPRLVCESLFMT